MNIATPAHDFADLAAEALLRRASQSAGFNRWSGFTLVAAGAGQVILELPVREDMTQHHGFAHGGIVGALLDTACSWAAATLVGDVVTASYTLQFHAPANAPLLRVSAETVKAGRRNVSVMARAEAVADDGTARHCATMLAMIARVGE